MKVKNITLREKAAILFSLLTGITDNITFYIIAKGSENNINRESYSTMGMQLKKKEHIQQYYNEAKEILHNYVINHIDSEGNTFALKNINFTNPEEFVQYLNAQANTITEERDRREYLKMLADLLRFKEGNKGGADDIQRFYTPQNCQNCELYKLQRSKLHP